MVTKKGLKTLGGLKKMYRKYKLPQNICINLYKSILRPALEYGSEIWGDASECHIKRLESIEQKSLTAALGVNRLAKREQVNIEAGVLPLRLRFKRKLIKTYQGEGFDIKSWEEYRERKKRRTTNRIEVKKRYLKEIKRMGIEVREARVISNEKLDKLMLKQWRLKVEATRESGDELLAPKVKLKYKYFTKNRTLQRVWHQARLGVVNTNCFLYKIKKVDTNKCQFDNEWETFEHIIYDCEGYRLERNSFPKNRNNAGMDDLKVLLDEDRPPPEKRKIASTVLKIIKKRKTNNHAKIGPAIKMEFVDI